MRTLGVVACIAGIGFMSSASLAMRTSGLPGTIVSTQEGSAVLGGDCIDSDNQSVGVCGGCGTTNTNGTMAGNHQESNQNCGSSYAIGCQYAVPGTGNCGG
jgi:hypothetical protein